MTFLFFLLFLPDFFGTMNGDGMGHTYCRTRVHRTSVLNDLDFLLRWILFIPSSCSSSGIILGDVMEEKRRNEKEERDDVSDS